MTRLDASNARLASTGRPAFRLVGVAEPEGRRAVPESAFVPVGTREPASEGERRMRRRHRLMLLLALEVLVLGLSNADRYRRPPAVTVDAPSIAGHVIT